MPSPIYRGPSSGPCCSLRPKNAPVTGSVVAWRTSQRLQQTSGHVHQASAALTVRLSVTRFTRRERIIKELNEIAPILDVVLDAVDKLTLLPNEQLTIVDLCSGFGFLAMFLSELLPPEKVCQTGCTRSCRQIRTLCRQR